MLIHNVEVEYIHYTEHTITACFTRKAMSRLLGMDHTERQMRPLSLRTELVTLIYGLCLLNLGACFALLPGTPVIVRLMRTPWLKPKSAVEKRVWEIGFIVSKPGK